jgi:hypothetical protein
MSMTPETLFLRYVWLFMLLGVALSTGYLWFRARNRIAKNPDLKEGYNRLFKGFFISMSIPWLVMGIGIILGGVSSFVDFSQPKGGNPFVLGFWLTVFLLLMLGVWWVYFREGAEFLAKHPGGLGAEITSPILVKLYFGVMCIVGIVVLVTLWIR